MLATMAPQPYPDFVVPPGYLTPHGAQAEVLLGSYFRSYLLAEGLLTGSDAADAQKPISAPIRSSGPTSPRPRSRLVSCRRRPCRSTRMHWDKSIRCSIQLRANVAIVDAERAAQEVNGIYDASAFASAYSASCLSSAACYSTTRRDAAGSADTRWHDRSNHACRSSSLPRPAPSNGHGHQCGRPE